MNKDQLKRLPVQALKALVVAGLFAWLIHKGALQWEYFRVPASGLPWLLAGAGSIAAGILLTGCRYWLILRINDIHPGLAYVLKSEVASTFANMCSIGPLGGDVARIYFVTKRCGQPLTVAGAAMVDRMVGLYGLLVLVAATMIHWGTAQAVDNPLLQAVPVLLLGAVAMGIGAGLMVLAKLLLGGVASGVLGLALTVGPALAALLVPDQAGTWWGLAAGFGAATLLTLLLTGERLETMHARLQRGGGLMEKISSLFRTVVIAKDHPGAMAMALAWAVLQQGLYVVAMYAFSRALPLPMRPDLAAIFFATPLTFILAVLPMPGAGLGVNETAFNYLLALAAPGMVGGASLYLFHRAWLILVSTLGVPFFFTYRKKLPPPQA